MRRLALLALTVLLVGLIAADLALRHLERRAAAEVAGASTVPAAAEVTADAAVPAPVAAPAGGALIDPAVRAEARARLARSGDGVFIDSLLALTDSIVRRWEGRPARALTVAIVEGGPIRFERAHAEVAREALAAWSASLPGLRFVEVADSSAADITIRWIDQFPYNRAGQTDLTWDRSGRVRRASIMLALRTSAGLEIPPRGLRSVALHETGHALGLPHSPDSLDVMFHATRSGAISERDRATLGLLYALPLGTLR